MARQFVVQVENKPGELAHLARALEPRSINTKHIGGLANVADRLAGAGVSICGTLMVGHKPGRVDMIFCVDDEAKAHAALRDAEIENIGVNG